jgi:hypothetical protein
MVAETIWLGMFQAEAGRGGTVSVRRKSDASSNTAASYAIPDEEEARKKLWTPKVKRSK